MKGSRKQDEPVALAEWKAQENEDWTPCYGGMGSRLKRIWAQALFTEQRGLCVYCGRRLNLAEFGVKSHIEHFWPKGKYKHKALKHKNLFLSCGGTLSTSPPSPTCGNKKGEWFDECVHVKPEYPNCTNKFEFRTNGDIIPAPGCSPSAETMITVLNLNHPELVAERKRVIATLDSDELEVSDFWEATDNLAKRSFAHMVFQRFGRALP